MLEHWFFFFIYVCLCVWVGEYRFFALPVIALFHSVDHVCYISIQSKCISLGLCSFNMTALSREMTAETVNLQCIDCSYFYAAEILHHALK